MAMVQLRFEPRAQELFAEARRKGHTRREAMRLLKRQLSNVIYRRMIRDLDIETSTSPSREEAA